MMNRLLTALVALVLLASACGSTSDSLSLGTTDDTDPPSISDDGEGAADDDGNGGGGGFSTFDEGVIDGMMASGLNREAAECVLRALQERDINLLELASGIEDGEIPDDFFQAALSCGDELDFGFGDLDNGFTDSSAQSYGDDPDLDLLWDTCEAGDLEACDDLFWTSAIGSDYESFGSTCGDTGNATFGECAGGSGAQSYGDDPDLDVLWDACEAGDGPSCDELYWTSPIDSDYEAFGASCGGQFENNTAGQCEEGIGVGNVEGGSYGDDPVLDALWDDCSAGDGAACDQLYFESPFDSEYEAFGDTCGERFAQSVLSCEQEIGAG